MNAQTNIKPGTSVYAKIAAVQGELARVGIAKTRRNQQGSGYNFRGIDDVYAALSPLLAAHGLVIVPRVTSREVIERASRAGGALFYVTVHADFDFISADDGSIHTASTFGEAMDSGDKATNKAMSAAYKYAAFMTFAIPTEGDNDADAHTPEVAATGQSQQSAVSPPVKPKAHSALKTAYRGFIHEGNGCGDGDEWSAFMATAQSVKLVNEIKAKLPHIWDGNNWPELAERPEEWECLEDYINRRATECARATANYATA